MNDLKNETRKYSRSDLISSYYKEDKEQRLVLNIDNLLIGFIILIFGSTFALIALCIESFRSYSKSKIEYGHMLISHFKTKRQF